MAKPVTKKNYSARETSDPLEISVAPVELVVPPGNTPADGKMLDLQMMVLFRGGKERTPDEYRALLQAGGFRLTEIIATPQQMSLIEAV